MSKRLFIVSNRLPFYATVEEGKTILIPSHGGLVTSISSYIEKVKNEREVIWAGAPGCEVSEWETARHQIAAHLVKFLPVLIDKRKYDSYYNGFSNSTLWPVFHSLISYTINSRASFRDYLEVNRIFCNTLCEQVTAEDIVWIHDYHLIPLMAMLKEKIPGIRTGFFLHTPFPPLKVFNNLYPEWQKVLVDGIIAADAVGLQTGEDVTNFREAALKMQHLFSDNKLGVFPVGIDFEKFHSAHGNTTVSDLRMQLKDRLKNQKIIFSLDRLDYTKGLYHRLKSYQYFLESNPGRLEKVVFIMVVFPSIRKNSLYHEESKALIETCIRQINQRFGNVSWQPVIYFHQNLSAEELHTFYTSADVALITPLKDGMNLVAKEFVASRKDQKGVLILSKNAGAVHELKQALMTDPYNFRDVAMTLKLALEMPGTEQEERMKQMQARVSENSVKLWGDRMIAAIEKSGSSAMGA